MGWPSALECRGGFPAPEVRALWRWHQAAARSGVECWMCDPGQEFGPPWTYMMGTLAGSHAAVRVVKWVGLRGTQEP